MRIRGAIRHDRLALANSRTCSAGSALIGKLSRSSFIVDCQARTRTFQRSMDLFARRHRSSVNIAAASDECNCILTTFGSTFSKNSLPPLTASERRLNLRSLCE